MNDTWQANNFVIDAATTKPNKRQQIIAARPDRSMVVLVNTGSNSLVLYPSQMAQNGLNLPPGASWGIHTKGALYVGSVAGSTLDVLETFGTTGADFFAPIPSATDPASLVDVTDRAGRLLGIVSGEVTADQGTNPWVVSVSGGVAVTGNVAITNFPATQPISGTVAVSNFPATQPVSGSVSVSNFPATQTVSGAVSVSNFPATQTVSGAVAVSNLPAVQTVDVDNFPATQQIGGAVTLARTVPPTVNQLDDEFIRVRQWSEWDRTMRLGGDGRAGTHHADGITALRAGER